MNLTPQWKKLVEELQVALPPYGDLNVIIRSQGSQPYMLKIVTKEDDRKLWLNVKEH